MSQSIRSKAESWHRRRPMFSPDLPRHVRIYFRKVLVSDALVIALVVAGASTALGRCASLINDLYDYEMS
jgi:hypothetical protein